MTAFWAGSAAGAAVVALAVRIELWRANRRVARERRAVLERLGLAMGRACDGCGSDWGHVHRVGSRWVCHGCLDNVHGGLQ